MKILLIGNYLFDGQESMQRFTNMLEISLSRLGHQVRVARPDPVFGRFYPSAIGVGKWLGYIDKFIVFPRTLHRLISWADIVHICDHSNAFYIKYLVHIPHLITCHDVLAIRSALGEIPGNYTKWTGRQFQKIILNGLNQAYRVVCISQKTKQELLRISSLNPTFVSCIYMGLNYPYKPMEDQEARKYLDQLSIAQDLSFIFHIGGDHWYKNRQGLLSTFYSLLQKTKPLNIYLVIAGSPLSFSMKQFIKEHDLTDRVLELGRVSNEELCALYSAAKLLLFPSLEEGFGWPIIEAQACGCPVFTSNYSPMNEVGGDAAIYIDPRNPTGTATKIAGSFADLESLEQKGFFNAQKFSPEKMTLQYVQEYEKIISEFSSDRG